MVTLCPTFSHSNFHNKNILTASEALLGHRLRYTELVSVKEIRYMKHFSDFNVLPPSYKAFFFIVKATQNKHLSKESWEAEAQRESAKREKSLQRDQNAWTQLWIWVFLLSPSYILYTASGYTLPKITFFLLCGA